MILLMACSIRSDFNSFFKKLIAFLFSLALVIFCVYFLTPSLLHESSSSQRDSQVHISPIPFLSVLDKELCQKRGKSLFSKKLIQQKASFLSKNKALTQIKFDYINLFFVPSNVCCYANFFLIDCSYQFLYLSILSSRSHPPTILSC